MTTSTTRTNSSYFGHSGVGGAGSGDGGGGRPARVQDSRWRFQDESLFPTPRRFVGGTKKYRAGRVSSVPLDLRAFE